MKNGQRRQPRMPNSRRSVDDAFLAGAESILLFGSPPRAAPVAADPWAAIWKALGSDWKRVGDDLRIVEDRKRVELGR